MGLEVASFIDGLVVGNPVGSTDAISEGDNHLRLIKTVLKASLPGLAGAAFRVQTKSGAYTVVGTDNTTLLRCTATLTLTLTAASTLGNQHIFYVYNDSRGIITIDPNSTELINGHRFSYVLPNQLAIVFCDGSSFFTLEDTQTHINPIFNSGMEISQEFVDTSATVSPGNTNRYGPDGFMVDITGVSAQIEMFRGTNVPSVGASQIFVNNSLEIQNKIAKAAQSASTFVQIKHIMEGYYYQSIAQRPFWFSFWVHSSQTGTYNIAFKNAGLDRSYVDFFTISAVNTLEYKTFLIDAPPSLGTWNYTSGTGLITIITLAGSAAQVNRQQWTAANAFLSTANVNWNVAISASFGITAPFINLGSRPTLWKNYGISFELARAQRYLTKSFELNQLPGQSASATGVLIDVAHSGGPFRLVKDFPVEMRIIPSVTLYNPEASNAFVRNFQDSTNTTGTVHLSTSTKQLVVAPQVISAGDNDDAMGVHFLADARL